MKTTKQENKASPPLNLAASVALSPRQIALRKLYRFVTIVGVIIAVCGLAVTLTLYGDRIFKKSRQNRTVFGRDLPIREPKLNPTDAPAGAAPEGMVWIRGGEFYMGTDVADEEDVPMFLDATDLHLVHVDGFWMDKHEVTNEQFAKFIEETKYLTEAEKQPNPKDFPDVPPSELKPFSIIFKKPEPGTYDLSRHEGWWDISYGASWKQPNGPGSTIKGIERYPAVHISYNDAVAYCKWAKKRLPTEAEWEFAGRGGLDRKKFSWGDEINPDGRWMANTWQGNFPLENKKLDGFEGAAPVKSFPANDYGLYDMAGNVWEWCADWYVQDYYSKCYDKDLTKAFRNPQGPDAGFDLREAQAAKRVQRGGSFMCSPNYCERYYIGARGKGEVTSAASHTGFRCAMNAK